MWEEGADSFGEALGPGGGGGGAGASGRDAIDGGIGLVNETPSQRTVAGWSTIPLPGPAVG